MPLTAYVCCVASGVSAQIPPYLPSGRIAENGHTLRCRRLQRRRADPMTAIGLTWRAKHRMFNIR
jgi:hypothetical protein